MCQHKTTVTSTPSGHWQHHQQQNGFQEANLLVTESSPTSLPPPLMIPNVNTTYTPLDYQRHYHHKQFFSSSIASPLTLNHSPMTPTSAQQDTILMNQSFYDPMPIQHEQPSKQSPMETSVTYSTPIISTTPRNMETPMTSPQQQQDQQKHLRFHTVLQAMTAVTQKTELSLTYLNRNQTYGIQLVDKLGNDGLIQSQVNISFHDPANRNAALSYWKFWIGQHKDPENARSLDLDTHQSIGILNVRYPSFDRITFDWHGRHGAKLFVRFHCLSTDFSRIKGIKGIPLRICMSSQVSVPDYNPLFERNYAGSFYQNEKCERELNYTEQSFCKVKLFRDKGAERKYKDDAKQFGKQFEKILYDGDPTKHPMWLMYNRSMPYTAFNGIAYAPSDVSSSASNDIPGNMHQQYREKYQTKRQQSTLSHYQRHSYHYSPYTKRPPTSNELVSTTTTTEISPLLPPLPLLAPTSSGTVTVPTQLYFSGHDSVLSSSSSPLLPDNDDTGHAMVAPNQQQKHDSYVGPSFFYLLGYSKPNQECDQ